MAKPGVVEALEQLEPKLRQLTEFLERLSDNDRNNFGALLNLPNAVDVISRCPNAEYRNMAILALALKEARERAAVPAQPAPVTKKQVSLFD